MYQCTMFIRRKSRNINLINCSIVILVVDGNCIMIIVGMILYWSHLYIYLPKFLQMPTLIWNDKHPHTGKTFLEMPLFLCDIFACIPFLLKCNLFAEIDTRRNSINAILYYNLNKNRTVIILSVFSEKQIPLNQKQCISKCHDNINLKIGHLVKNNFCQIHEHQLSSISKTL